MAERTRGSEGDGGGEVEMREGGRREEKRGEGGGTREGGKQRQRMMGPRQFLLHVHITYTCLPMTLMCVAHESHVL